MNEALKEIKSGIGLGTLKFGMTREEVKAALGEPMESEVYSYSETEEDLTESWHYDKLELSVGFDQEEDWKLVTFSITSDFYQLNNKSIIGMTAKELVDFLEGLNVDDIQFEDWSDEENSDHKLIFTNELAINFWLDKEIVREIQWGPILNEED